MKFCALHSGLTQTLTNMSFLTVSAMLRDKSLLKIGLDASASLLQQFHEAFFVLDALLCLAADLLAQIGIQFLNQSDQCGLGLFAHLFLQVDHLLDA